VRARDGSALPSALTAASNKSYAAVDGHGVALDRRLMTPLRLDQQHNAELFQAQDALGDMRNGFATAKPASRLRAVGPLYQSRWRLILGLVLVPCLALAGIAAMNASRAVAIVRPPRIPVDTAEVQRLLPGAADVSFVGDDGVVLSGTYVAPRNGAVVVLVHGLFANREELLPEAQLLAAHGYGVLLYDNRAHGNSGGSVATWGQLEADDVTRAVDFVGQRTLVPPGKIGLVGLSIGGTAVMREAIGDSRIGSVVVEATYSSMADEIAYMYGRWGPLSRWPALWVGQIIGGMDYSKLVATDLAASLAPRPVLLVYGANDIDVPIAQGKRMAKAVGEPDSLFVADTHLHGRFMRASNASKYADRLLSFLQSTLLG
jgi:uncharacterized protein